MTTLLPLAVLTGVQSAAAPAATETDGPPSISERTAGLVRLEGFVDL